MSFFPAQTKCFLSQLLHLLLASTPVAVSILHGGREPHPGFWRRPSTCLTKLMLFLLSGAPVCCCYSSFGTRNRILLLWLLGLGLRWRLVVVVVVVVVVVAVVVAVVMCCQYGYGYPYGCFILDSFIFAKLSPAQYVAASDI